MDSARFDGWVRSFRPSRSRRQALRSMVGLAAGASAFALSRGVQADEGTPGVAPIANSELPLESEIAWMPEWTVKSGTFQEVGELLAEMEASARKEAGTLSYALYLSEDRKTITFYERYADEAAVLAHQATFSARFEKRANDAMTCSRITVMGSPGEEIRHSISGCNPVYLTPFAGFTAR